MSTITIADFLGELFQNYPNTALNVFELRSHHAVTFPCYDVMCFLALTSKILPRQGCWRARGEWVPCTIHSPFKWEDCNCTYLLMHNAVLYLFWTFNQYPSQNVLLLFLFSSGRLLSCFMSVGAALLYLTNYTRNRQLSCPSTKRQPTWPNSITSFCAIIWLMPGGTATRSSMPMVFCSATDLKR